MRKSPIRQSIAAAAVLAMAGLVWAAGKPGVVHTRDGNVYDGTVDEREQNVVVNVRGIETTIARDNVESLTYGDFDQRWSDNYAKLDPKDTAGRITLARRAFDERRYDLTERAARDTLSIDANNAEAADLLRSTAAQRKLDRNAPPGSAAGNDNGTSPLAPTTPAPVKAFGAWNTLSPDDVNHVRQIEVNERDTKVRFNFANRVQKRFYDANPRLADEFTSYNEYVKQPPVTQAMRIIKDGSREMVKDVKVVTDPEVFAGFRRDVMPLVLQGCATSGCHGGSNAASTKFGLISPATEPVAVYTNFYVLQSYSTKAAPSANTNGQMVGGTVTPQMARMIDRVRPDQSLVLEYGLAEAQADQKHPRVRGYNGIYPRGREDAKYKAILDFIQSLTPIQPEYGIDFKLQRAGGATTQPTTSEAP